MDTTTVRRLLKPHARRLVSMVTQQPAKLRPEKMMAGYRTGCFPWPGRLGLIQWQDPEIRAVIPLDDRFRVGKRLTKKISSGYFTVTFDQAFEQVIEGCAEPRPGREDTWLSRDLINAYMGLYKSGYAHSVEVWREGQLVGGEYGVAVGGYYSGESMFTREDYASRVALVALVERLRERGFRLLDAQEMSPLTQEFGGYEVPREEFKSLHAEAVANDVVF